ncbi:hypothetical protein NDU88_006596 [Pleurodeles waltl]|uniref:Endonuclease/exonuclease/phosphatase domain-containing protein n=1 Tax=Pleurodeles waltl TaxID=8319 RepID=A0AAV7PIU0_PLEWA|nr:hypothetical protein NDU88_006596 [Pleurodeles waltl]
MQNFELCWLESAQAQVVLLQEMHLKANAKLPRLTACIAHSFYASADAVVRGVAVLFSRKFVRRINIVMRDPQMRWIIVTAILAGKEVHFVSYYGPIEEDIKPMQKLYTQLSLFQGYFIIGGDFNTIRNTLWDTSRKNKAQNKPKTSQLLAKLMLDLALVDVWRADHLYAKEFTLFQKVQYGIKN